MPCSHIVDPDLGQPAAGVFAATAHGVSLRQLRMAFVLGGGLALSALLPLFQEAVFWGWLLVFYLFTLALEVVLLQKTRQEQGV